MMTTRLLRCTKSTVKDSSKKTKKKLIKMGFTIKEVTFMTRKSREGRVKILVI